MTELGKSILFVFIGLIPFIGFSQSDSILSEPEVFIIVETMPEYPGGQEEMVLFIQKNVHYPNEARDENIQGIVYVNFIVETTGKVANIKVIRGVYPSLDAEAVRVVKLMPRWKPGTQKGKPVRVTFNLPINFSLK